MITFNGKEYRTREIAGYIFSTEDLEDAIFDDDMKYINEEAREVDDSIAGYLTPEQFDALSDAAVWRLIYDGDDLQHFLLTQ